MKKTIYFFVLYILFQLITLFNQSLFSQPIWHDNFDVDTLHHFPMNWIASGNGMTSTITDTNYVSLPYSCEMTGISGENSEALLHRQFDSAFSCYQFQFYYLFTGIGQVGGHAYHGVFGLQKDPVTPTSDYRDIVIFDTNHTIKTWLSQTVIGHYSDNQWVKIKVVYERPGAQIRISYYVNDLFIMSESTPAYAYESQLKYCTLKSGDTKCLFEDIVASVYNPKIVAGHDTTVCFGQPVTLTATGGTTFNWNHGVIQGVPFVPLTTMTYTVTGASCGGVDTSAVTVFVNPNPVVGISASSTTICAGNTITLTASGANGFLWSNGLGTSNTVTVAPVTTTTYVVTGTSAGCTSTASITITVNPLPVLNVSTTANPICTGSSTTLIVSGATTYTWSNGLGTSAHVGVTPATTTTYTVTGTTMGCTASAAVTVTVNTIPVVNVSTSAGAICPGTSATLTASGAATYQWSNTPATSNPLTVTPAATTIYTVTGTLAGCTATASVGVTVSPIVSISTTAGHICAGTSVTLTASGAALYSWNQGLGNSCQVSVTPATTTTFTVTGILNGCSNAASVTITVNPIPIVNISATLTSLCAGNSTILTASGASNYTWSNSLGTSNPVTVSPAAATIYTVTGTSAGCSGAANITIHVNPIPIVSITAPVNPICAGTSTTLTASGATTYTWSNGLGTLSHATVTPAATTTYTVTGTANGCVATASYTVTVTPHPVVTISPSSNPICAGNPATLTATGATTYNWSNGLGTVNHVTVTPASATTYTVTGTTSGCTSSTSITVNVNPIPIVSVVASVNPVCPGSPTILTTNGATTYNWSNGLGTTNSVTASPTATTTYTVTGTSGGCTNTASITVIVNPIVTIAASANTICNGTSTTLTASGASGYSWCNGLGTSNHVTVAPASTTTYTVTGTLNGCSNTANITITVNPIPTLNTTASPNPICPGNSSTLTATGATTYNWSNGLGTLNHATVTPAATTTYTVTGTSNGCSNTATVVVNVNPTPVINVTASVNPICPGTSTTLTASGGTSYTWSNGLGTINPRTVSPATTTTYTVTGTNGGCTNTASITIVVNPIVTITATPSTVCSGTSSTLTANGAATYLWSNGLGASNPLIVNPVATTIYTVTGTLNGCANTANVTVNVIPIPPINISASPTSICPGSSTTLTATGGTTYNWCNGLGTLNHVTVSPVTTTTYTVTGTLNGCTGTANITIVVNPIPNVSVSASVNPICPGSSTILTASGATSYTWSNGLGTTNPVTATPPTTTTYTVTGSALGCTNTASITITVNPIVTVTATPNTVCSGTTSTLTANGAATYTWSNGLGTSNPLIVNPVATTIYTVTGTLNGCTNTANVTVNVIPIPPINISASPTSICPGYSTILTATGGTTYNWCNGLGTLNHVTVSPVTTTTYTVTGTLNGCTGTANVTVVVNPIPNVSVLASVNPICPGSSTILTASGATSYTWSNGLGTTNPVTATPPTTTTYTVTGSALGCTNTASITVTVNPIVTISASATTVCAGTMVTFTANGASGYLWSNGLGTTNPVTVNPVTTTTYTVTGTLNGCSNTANITVNAIPNPTVSISSSPAAICPGASTTITATGASTYNWCNGMGTVSQIAVTPASTTIYTVTGTANGCSSSANITVVVNPLPTVSISPSVNPICPGSSTTLTGLGATSYVWNNSLGTTNPVVATPAATTIYTVTGTLLGCTNTASITVVVNPVVTVTASVNTVCAGLLVTFTANGAAGYVWSNGLGTTNPVTANPVTTTTYTVTGTLNGCTNMASVTVNVIPNPTLSITSSSNSLCPGTSTTMTAGGASTYAWSNGLGTLNQVSLTPASTTTYTVTGTTNGCNSTANTTIVVNPTPTINISTSANPVCIGSSTTLTATGALNYMWNPGTGLNSTTNNSVVATPNVSTTYNVVGTDVHGCTGSASVFVDVININTTATAVNDHCGQAIGKLTAVPSGICSQGFTYLWNTFPQQSTQIVNNVLAGTYTVTVTCSGCVATATAVVGNIGGPSAFITNKANTTCGLPDGMASVAESGGTSPFSYLWSDGQNTPLLSNVGAGTYTVTVDDVAGCSATTSVTIMGSAALLVSTSSTFSACNIDNGTATVVVTQGVGNYSYAWSVNPAQNTPTATGLAAGNYTVTVSDSLCTVTEMVSVLNPQGPHAYFTADHESLTFGEGDVNFQNNSSGNIVNWQWFFGDGSPAMSGPIAQHNFMDVGTYYVTLQVTDSNGCTNSYVDTIVVNEIFAFYIPNTFTPNGDGLNDVFQPKGSNVSPDDYEMDIFDRWGTVVFTSTDFEKGWNGTVKNKGKQNKDITMGVYYYQISLKDLKGKPHTYSGQINLIP